MKNPKVRFSLEETGTIYCYVSNQSLQPSGFYATENGVVYDMEVLKQLLDKEQHIDEAIVGRVPATGECHWVFEGDIQNEVSAQKGGDSDQVQLRLKQLQDANLKLMADNQALQNDKDAILADHAQLVQKLTEERERNANVQSIEMIPAQQLADELSKRLDLDEVVRAARGAPASTPSAQAQAEQSGGAPAADIAGAMAPQDATPQKEATEGQPS